MAIHERLDWEQVEAGHYEAKGVYEGVPFDFTILYHEKTRRWATTDNIRKKESGKSKTAAFSRSFRVCKRNTRSYLSRLAS